MFSDETQMDGMPPVEQSKKAIGHVLVQIRDHAHVGWYLGYGTQTFSLLTEAYATLTGKSVMEVRDAFEPVRASDPTERGEEES